MEVGEKKNNNPNFEKKTSNALKADRAIHRIILSLVTELSLCQELFHSFLTRQLVVTQTMSTVNNVTRALVDRLTVTENERTSMFREGIQSDDLSKISCSSEDRKK